MNPATILNLAKATKSSGELLRKLCEDVNLSNGQKVFIVHGMGQASVRGTYQGLTNGGMAKVKTEGGETHTVMAHLVFPN